MEIRKVGWEGGTIEERKNNTKKGERIKVLKERKMGGWVDVWIEMVNSEQIFL
jgi:hypothetical protein